MIGYALDVLARARAAWECPKCQKMHRRAQAAESAAAKAIRQNDHAQLWKTVAYLKGRAELYQERMILFRQRYRAEVSKIRASGLVDTKHPGSKNETGYLDILVDRLIAQASDSPSEPER